MKNMKILAMRIFKKRKEEYLGNYKLVGLMSVLRKIVKQILLKCFGNQNRKVIGRGHLGLTKGKQFLTTLTAIYEEIKRSAGKR